MADRPVPLAVDGSGTPLNQSVLKALSILRAAATPEGASVSSLARACGIPRATVQRLVQTLEHEGFVVRSGEDERVLVGPEVARLAAGADISTSVRDVARPVVVDLVDRVRESVTLSLVTPDGELDLVEQVDAPHLLRPRSWVGQRFPLHCSATGKILLAYMEPDLRRVILDRGLERFTAATITDPAQLEREVTVARNQGFAVVRDELEEGLTGIGATIHTSTGGLLGVVTASGPTQRLDDARGRDAVTALLSAAREIEERLAPARAS